MQIFYDAQGKLTPQSKVWLYLKFKLNQVFMVVLVTCKNEEDPIKIEGPRVITTLSINFLRCSRAANSIIGDGILTEFKLIQAFIVVLLICKNE